MKKVFLNKFITALMNLFHTKKRLNHWINEQLYIFLMDITKAKNIT